jgi:hypothetical protein
MLRVSLEFHPNCCFKGLITRFEFNPSHQGIFKSQKSDFSKFLLFLFPTFNFSTDKSLNQLPVFASVFFPRFAPGSTPVSSVAP